MPTEPTRKSDLVFATTHDGLTLPVIDVTRPPYAVRDDPASIVKLREAFTEWLRKQQRAPRFVMKLLMRLATRRSRLARTLFTSDQGYLDSITTYLLKLRPEDLPPGFNKLDRRIIDTPHAPLLLLRMQQIAKLMAEALQEPLAGDPAAPLHLINIAGGPALDSINALIFLARQHPLLLNRPVAIDVLDAQAEGPRFGANALAALQAVGAPLRGIDVTFTHRRYDWNDTAPLRALLAATRGAVTVASSEGGLFEYGSDDAIIANLTALRAGGVAFVAGSVTGASDLRKEMIAQTRFKLHPRGLAGFAPLAARGGYAIARSEPGLFSDQVLLQASR